MQPHRENHSMKRTVFLFALVALLFPLYSFAYTQVVDGIEWTYTVSNGEASVGGGQYSQAVPTWTSGAIAIPTMLGGYTVTRIGGYAFSGCSRLTSVTIPGSVTRIGNCAFSGCSGLTSVTIPDSVTSIEWSAFHGCSGLTSITIPDGVTSIEDWAFDGCSGLTSITIPDSVTSIGYYAFLGCSGLSSITIPNGVTSIRGGAFDGCPDEFFDTISIPGVRLVDGWAVGYTDSLSGNLDLTGVRGIADSTFGNCSNLSSVTIPDGVTSIGEEAFSGCSGLTSITIPNGVTSIGSSAFYNCSGLTSITIPDSVTSIGGSAFSGCSGLTSVTIPVGVTSIEGSAFFGCSGLMSITIPDGVASIGGSAFRSCSGLTSVTIPNSVTRIGDSTFDGCPDELFDTTSIPDVKLVDGWVVGHTESLSGSLVLTGIRGIANDAFSGCSELTSVTISSGVTSIGAYAFYLCSGLTSVTIPDSVTCIGSNAFTDCSGLAEVHISDLAAWCGISFESSTANPCHYAHRLFLNGEEITDLVIPDSVTSLSDYAFYGCSGLTSVTIPDSVTSIGYCAFYGCSGLTSVTIPDSVTNIGEYAFSGCSGLTSVTIPDSVTSIGNYAFNNCSGLTAITIPDSVAEIGRYAFCGCSGVSSLIIPDSVVSLEEGAFEACSGLKTIILGDGITSLSGFRFSSYWQVISEREHIWHEYGDYPNLQTVVLGTGIQEIGYATFRHCSSLVSISFSNSITNIGSCSFQDCSGLTSVVIPDSVTSIELDAFRGCSGLTSITIPDSVTSIESGAFDGCRGLTSITIPDSVTSIEGWMFYGCWELTSVAIPDSITSIGHSAFAGCRRLTSITIPGSVTNIGDSAFSGCSGLMSITIPDSVTSIGDYAFYDCSELTSITVPEWLLDQSDSWGLPSGCQVVVSDNPCVDVDGVAIPKTWISRNAADALAAAGGNYWAAARVKAANGRPVWECYVADLDPEDPDDDLVAGIEMSVGAPRVWILKGESGERNYEIQGAPSPNGPWGERNEYSRFFRIRVAEGFTSYTITFDSAGGSAVPSITAAYGAAVTAPAAPTKDGYTFAVWSPAFPATMPLGGAALVAQWTPKNYIITFDSAGGSAIPSITAAYGAALSAPTAPTKDGYTFAGWSPAFPATMPLGGATLVAQWTPKNYTVTFDTDGGSAVASITAAYGAALTTPAAPTKDGYTFAGWSPAFPATMPLGGAALVAQWTPKNYTITFDSAGGSAVAPITAAYGAALSAPTAPTKDGYTFAGWSPAFPATMPLGGAALVAQWTPKSYTITFDSAGGSAVPSITAAYGAAVTAPASPTKDGYTFAGWSPAFPATMPLGGATLVARWTESQTGDFTWTVSGNEITITGCEQRPTGALVIPSEINGYPVTAIGSSAFDGCTGMTSVTIPDSVTSIGYDAFVWCSGLEEVRISDLAAWCGLSFASGQANPCYHAHRLFVNGEEIKALVVPDGVASIGDYAFDGCSGLTSVTIPDSVTSVGTATFRDCSNLVTISIPASLQGQTSDWWLPSNCQIIVRD